MELQNYHFTMNYQDKQQTNYIIFGIVLSEQEAEMEKESGKLLLRA